jgi:hypothetical protein
MSDVAQRYTKQRLVDINNIAITKMYSISPNHQTSQS